MPNERKIKKGEPHPVTEQALEYLQSLDYTTLKRWEDTLRTGAKQGHRISEVCDQTLENMQNDLPASDTEILGLAFMILNAEK